MSTPTPTPTPIPLRMTVTVTTMHKNTVPAKVNATFEDKLNNPKSKQSDVDEILLK